MLERNGRSRRRPRSGFALDGGPHERPEDGMCAMELVAWIAGERHSANPSCACPLLTSMVQVLNDGMSDRARQRLIDYALPLARSRADEATTARRSALAAEWLEDDAPRFEHAEDFVFVRDAVALAASWRDGVPHTGALLLAEDDAIMRGGADGCAPSREELDDSLFALLDRMLSLPHEDAGMVVLT